MTTVRELIHQLTADYIDLDAEVQVTGEEYDLTTSFTVTATAGVVRIEAE
jgi:hypothetical protein